MFEFLYSLASLFSLGSNTAVSKRAIHSASRYQAIVYMYIVLSILLVIAAVVFGVQFPVPGAILPILIFSIIVGALAIIARYKAIEMGKASIISPLGKTYVILVLLIGILVFGESLSLTNAFASLLILISAGIISFSGKKLTDLSIERGVPFILLSILGWGIYYSLLKPIVAALGPFAATFYLEIGITMFVLGYAIIRKKKTALPDPASSRFIVTSGFLVFVGSLAYSFSVEAIGIALTAVIVSCTPAVNLIASRILLGEKLSYAKYGAIALLIVGLIVLFTF
jgi:transporter family protein